MITNLLILCGVPGSGKSTWVKNNLAKFKGYTVVVSRDEIRYQMLGPDDNYFSKEDEVYKKFINDIIQAIVEEEVDNVIVDATHINAGSRTKLLRSLGACTLDTKMSALYFDTTLDWCLEHNALRSGREIVPTSALTRMYQNRTVPTFEEGFEEIIIYNPETNHKRWYFNNGE